MSTSSSGRKRCSYKNCCNTTHSSPSLSFFKFPVKNQERCITWIVNCGRDDLIDLPNSKLRYKVLCSLHFKVSAFTNLCKNRLLPNNHDLAIPIPWHEDESQMPNSPPTPAEQLKPKIPMKDHLQLQHTHAAPSENDLQQPLPLHTPEESFKQFNEGFKLLANSPQQISEIKCQTPYNNTENHTPRKKKLIVALSKHKISLKKSRNKIQHLSKHMTGPKLTKRSEFTKELPNYLCGDVLTFVRMQFHYKKNRAWSKEEKEISLSIYYKSPSTYRFLRERGFKLPCITLIRKWVNICNISPGFSTEMSSKLERKVKSMTVDEKQCVLLMDEMSIKKALEYDQKNDVIEGFQDLGPLGRSNEMASHALLFLLRGLKYHWKFPFAYVLSNNSTKSKSLATLLEQCIEEVLKTGLQIRAIVCDQGSTNAAAVRSLGVTADNPYLFIGNRKIHLVYDVPHVIKSIRNNLMKHDFFVDGKVVSWTDVSTFHMMDKATKLDCRAAPKLSERHINPQSFQKMSVKLATQVMSASVSRGMRAACVVGALNSSTALNTAMFIGRLNDIFDCLNSKYCYDSNPFRRPLSSSNENVIKCLRDALPYIATWSINAAQKSPPCFTGLAMSIRSCLALFDEMNNESNSYLLTGRLNQDPLENMFGVLRQRGGYRENPSAKNFRQSLQQAMPVRLMNPPGSANCEPDSDLNLEVHNDEQLKSVPTQVPEDMDLPEEIKGPGLNSSVNSRLPANSLMNYEVLSGLKFVLEEMVEENLDGEPVDEQMPDYQAMEDLTFSENSVFNVETISKEKIRHSLLETTVWEENVISYIGGWLVKKCLDRFKCASCETTLLSSGKLTLEIPKEEVLIQMKAFTCHTGEVANLHRPSQKFNDVLKRQIVVFSGLFEKHCFVKGVGKVLLQEIERDTDAQLEGWFYIAEGCKPHRLYMLWMLVKCKLYYSTKWASNDIRDRAILNKRKNFNTVKLNSKLRKLTHV